MKKSHFVVVKSSSGPSTLVPMKRWLRDNPQEIPEGLDATSSTSYQLRRALRKKGWELEELDEKTLLIKPDSTGSTAFADTLLEEESEGTNEKYEDEITEAAEITFGLEKDLQAALRANISQLEPGLAIIDEGKERITDAGRIDITAKDIRGNVVVIELKAGTASPDVIAQILAYMGAVSEEDKKPIRGILVAGDFHKRVVWASRAIPNVELRKYSFQFSFEPVK